MDRLELAHPLEDVLPLSPIQRLYHAMEASSGGLGFEAWRLRLQGPLDAEALRGAWEDVLAFHPILRTVFVSEGLSEPVQVVIPEARPAWCEEDWRARPPAAREDGMRLLLSSESELGFDIARAPSPVSFSCGWRTRHTSSCGARTTCRWTAGRGRSCCATSPRSTNHASEGAPGLGVPRSLRALPRVVARERARFDRFLAGGSRGIPRAHARPAPRGRRPPAAAPRAKRRARCPSPSPRRSDRSRAGGQVTLSTRRAGGVGAAPRTLERRAHDVTFGAAFSGRPRSCRASSPWSAPA